MSGEEPESITKSFLDSVSRLRRAQSNPRNDIKSVNYINTKDDYFNKMTNKYDVAIIGGGPAGSSAALFLIEAGFNVCVIEKKKFPRETLCGEFLSHEVTGHLKRLDLYNDFLQLSPNIIRTVKFVNDNGKFAETDLNFTAYGLSRGKFDDFLLDAVKNKSAEVFQPFEVKEILKTGGGFLIYADNKERSLEISADKIIAAYGKQNILDKKLFRGFVNNQSSLNGIKFHIDESFFNNLDKSVIQIFCGSGIYCGINAVEENKVTVCFLENKNHDEIKSKERLKNLINNNIQMRRLFKEGIEKVIDQSPLYGTGNIYFGKRELVQNGIFMIGDSAHVIAPLAGDGIGMAIENGWLIADVLHRQKILGLDEIQTQMLYESEWEKLFGKRIFAAKAIQNIILNNSLRKIGFGIIKYFPAFIPKLIRLTRS